jgi:hypothetical protein
MEMALNVNLISSPSVAVTGEYCALAFVATPFDAETAMGLNCALKEILLCYALRANQVKVGTYTQAAALLQWAKESHLPVKIEAELEATTRKVKVYSIEVSGYKLDLYEQEY